MPPRQPPARMRAVIRQDAVAFDLRASRRAAPAMRCARYAALTKDTPAAARHTDTSRSVTSRARHRSAVNAGSKVVPGSRSQLRQNRTRRRVVAVRAEAPRHDAAALPCRAAARRRCRQPVAVRQQRLRHGRDACKHAETTVLSKPPPRRQRYYHGSRRRLPRFARQTRFAH